MLYHSIVYNVIDVYNVAYTQLRSSALCDADWGSIRLEDQLVLTVQDGSVTWLSTDSSARTADQNVFVVFS